MDDEDKKIGAGKNTGNISMGAVAIISVAVLLTVAVVCLTLVYFDISKQYVVESQGNIQNTKGEGAQGNLQNDISPEPAKEAEVAEGMFEMSMNTIWKFPSGDKPSYQAYVANAPSNTRSIIIEVSLDETGEVVFASPVIQVGSEVDSITLDTPLKKGNYAATCRYSLLNEDGSENSTFSVAVNISVES